MVKRIAIIGSGITGLVAAHGSLRAGYRVDLYSDRTARQWLEPISAPARELLAFSDMAMARRMVAAQSGKPWLWNGVRGRTSIARDQVRMRLGGRSRNVPSPG